MSEYIVDRENVFPYGFHRERIVRCRDCKNYLDGWCMFEDGNGDYLRMSREPEGFCAWGERREP